MCIRDRIRPVDVVARNTGSKLADAVATVPTDIHAEKEIFDRVENRKAGSTGVIHRSSAYAKLGTGTRARYSECMAVSYTHLTIAISHRFLLC